MRITFLQEAFWPAIGGIERVTMKACQELARRGHETCVITAKGEFLRDQESVNGIQVYRLPFRRALQERDVEAILRTRSELSRILQQVRPDILQLNFSGPTGYFFLSARESKKIPWLLSIRHPIGEMEAEPGSIVHKLLDNADWITGNSAYTLREILEVCPAAQARTSLIYNGMSVPDAYPADLPFDPPHFVLVGRLIPDKGVHTAIEAFGLVRTRCPDARLTIAGDGPSRIQLERLATSVAGTGAVRFTGWVAPDDIADLINSATIGLMPSREESFGLAALEASMMGRPVIVSDVGGLPEVVLHERTGLVVSRDNPDELARAMLRLIEDRGECARMGAEGRVRALKRFSFDRYIDEHEELYSSLAATSADHRKAG